MTNGFGSPQRGQTDPLAALVAVSAVIVAIGLYGLYLGTLLPGTSDRTPERTAIDRISADLEENGVFHAHEHSRNVSSEIRRSSLPQGSTVHVTVRTSTDGSETAIAVARFGTDGTPRSTSGLERPPDRATSAERPIPVAVDIRADVRAGTLRVEVWD